MAVIRNIIAVIAGIIVGSITNSGIIVIGHQLIPPPVDIAEQSIEGMAEIMSQMTAQDFIFPFLAHAIGTLIGAYVAARIATSSHMRLALTVGMFFLFGGIYMVYMLAGTPVWFAIVDIVLAYIPMAYLGYRIAHPQQSFTA